MPQTEVSEVIFGFGHANIQATHKATLEITKDTHVSTNGDCILVVSADKGLSELKPEFKEKMQKPFSKITITIEAGNVKERVHAEGSPHLTLTHPNEIVIRKSDYVSDRTLAVNADKAAKDLSRTLVEKLRNPKQKVKITLTVYG